MKLKKLSYELTICEVASVDEIDLDCDFYIAALSGDNITLVCPVENVPPTAIAREDGWWGFAFRSEGGTPVAGALREIQDGLARSGVKALAVSTFGIGCVLTRFEDFERAELALTMAGHSIV